MLISFLLFLTGFTLIGLSSSRKSLGTKQDYYIASKSVPPWLVGLSAVATNNSGYMFIGVIGYTYTTGLASFWLMAGWISGDYLASLFVHNRLRKAAENTGSVSYAGVLSHWYGNSHDIVQRLIGIISLIFLLTYAAAQLTAGSKALFVLLDWPLWSGAVVGAILVSMYCMAGGIRASIWTDAAQSIVMIIAMAVLLVVAIISAGGPAEAIASLNAVEGYMDWFPKDLVVPGIAGGILFAVSWLFAGMSVIGQPHIMVRFMTLNDSGKMRQARAWYYLWFTAFYFSATCVGLLARIYLNDASAFDAELALPLMAQQLLPGFMVGLILAGIFSATMSTADSLVLSCSSSLTHDLFEKKVSKTVYLKISTLVITGLALLLALLNKQSVFNLVIFAWSGLASAFAPLLLALCLGMRPSQNLTIIAVLIGFSVAVIWRLLGLHENVYEGLPGICSGLAVLGASQLQKKIKPRSPPINS